MKAVKHLPDVLSVPVGTQLRCGKRSYTKATSGRWSVDLTPDLLDEVYQCYVIDRMTLREAKVALALPGMPTINVQKVLEEQGWMRSHYGRNASRDKWYAENKKALVRAVKEYGVELTSIYRWAGVPKQAKMVRDRSGNSRLRVAAAKRSSGWLSKMEVNTWNALLSLDVDAISFAEYQHAVHQMSFLALRRFKLAKRLGTGRNIHLDHKLSKYYGFHTKDSNPVHGRKKLNVKRPEVVPLRYICHPANLRIVDSSVNCTKRFSAMLTANELRALVKRSEFQLRPINFNEEMSTLMKALGISKYKGEQ